MTGPTPLPLALLADDDGQVRRAVSAVLRRAGWRTQEVASGDGVLPAARACRPDLVILDLMMPGADGYTVLAQIKQDPRLRRVPILLMSGEPAEVHRAIGMDLGATEFVEKPFDPARLLAIVRRVVGGGVPS
ncbi:MAG: response regulator [Planctomycetota bacterium]